MEKFPLNRDHMKEAIKNHLDFLERNFKLKGLDFEVEYVEFYGSRSKYSAKEPTQDSDIDVFVEYKGTAREDDMFRCLNKNTNSLYINTFRVDFKPVKKPIEEYLNNIIKEQKLDIKPDKVRLNFKKESI
jgi:predicted nucleotidyltransferase